MLLATAIAHSKCKHARPHAWLCSPDASVLVAAALAQSALTGHGPAAESAASQSARGKCKVAGAAVGLSLRHLYNPVLLLLHADQAVLAAADHAAAAAAAGFAAAGVFAAGLYQVPVAVDAADERVHWLCCVGVLS